MDKKNHKVVIAIMLSMFLAAFEGTVVTTAMPTIANSLNGYDLISWIFSAYLLTSAVSTPIYGKLSDLYGRKKMLSVGIIIFLTGSSLCGFSQTMLQLIIFRALQGLGAGSILTITYTIIGDLFDVSERAKIQGWLSTVWGIASLVGPFIGGFLINYLSWHWIFFINVPFGIIAIIILNKNLQENIEKTSPKIDYLGAFLLTISIVFLLLGVLSTSLKVAGIFVMISIISLVIFYFTEKHFEEPIVPFDIFNKTTTLANLICFITAGVLAAIETYSPLYIQNVLGFNAIISGLSMAPMSITWLSSSFILAKALPKYGHKKILKLATLLLVVSTLCLKFLGTSSPIIFLMICTTIMGFGFGSIFTTTTIVVQTHVLEQKRGVSTSTNALIRTLGQTIFVSIFGGILNSGISSYFNKLGISGITPDNIVSQTSKNISILQIKESFFTGVHSIFVTLTFFMIVCLICALILPKKNKYQ
ncbi:MFS transporter [Clostridiaceae bacterium 14S0207]|nr:MFS transporter [Clostridiaceae bacterium 14S0207]